MKKTQHLGWPLVLILAFLPALLWAISPYAVKTTASWSLLALGVGQVTALVGTAMFALSLFLSARLKSFEKVFPGINEVYAKHSKLGKWSLMLLLIHPLSLIPTYGAKLLVPGYNAAVNWGLLSLSLMLGLLVITLYLRPRYNLWKWTHKFLGFAFFFGALHGWMISSTVTQDMLLRSYIFGLSGLGLAAYTYRTLLGFILVKRYNYTVDSVKAVGRNTVQIRLLPKQKGMVYEAGQFIFVSFNDPVLGKEVHPFSISSAPEDSSLEITVKNLGDYTSRLSALAKGVEARIEGPYGVFNFRNKELKNQIWIAGGIGVTPFVSMARSLKVDDPYQVDLYYCVQEESEEVYAEELKTIAALTKGKLRLIEHPSKTCGRISADVIEQKSSGLQEKEILMCAPPAMIHALKDQFRAKKIMKNRLHSEEFAF